MIRPSGSKGADHLNITIRFAPDTYLNVDVEEHRDPDQPRTALGRRPVQAQESFRAHSKVAQHLIPTFKRRNHIISFLKVGIKCWATLTLHVEPELEAPMP